MLTESMTTEHMLSTSVVCEQNSQDDEENYYILIDGNHTYKAMQILIETGRMKADDSHDTMHYYVHKNLDIATATGIGFQKTPKISAARQWLTWKGGNFEENAGGNQTDDRGKAELRANIQQIESAYGEY